MPRVFLPESVPSPVTSHFIGALYRPYFHLYVWIALSSINHHLSLSLFQCAPSNSPMWLMTTQALMKACKSKGSASTWYLGRPRTEEFVFKIEKEKRAIFQLCLARSYSLAALNLAFVILFVVLESIMSPSSSSERKRQTRGSLLHSAEVNSSSEPDVVTQGTQTFFLSV